MKALEELCLAFVWLMKITKNPNPFYDLVDFICYDDQKFVYVFKISANILASLGNYIWFFIWNNIKLHVVGNFPLDPFNSWVHYSKWLWKKSADL